MTATSITIWRCDAACEQTAPEKADGWHSAIYTHGCPGHAEIVEEHAALVDHRTRGRGAREATTWFLRCACGWVPTPNWANHTARHLHEAHKKHVANAAGLYEQVDVP